MTTLQRRFRLILAGIVGLMGCGREAERPPATPIPAPATEAQVTSPAPTRPASWPMEVIDGFGRKVVIARPPLRVVSLAPSNTEILFAVGAADIVVGRTTVCSYPPEAAAVAAVGGMTPKTINLEALVALQPDLVLTTCGVQEPLIAPLDRLSLPVVALDADDFEGVARNIRLVGSLTSHAEAGDQLATRFRARVEAVRKRVAVRTVPRPRVLYLVGEDPLMTAGPQTFIGRMIETAGGINVFDDTTMRYPRPSEEEILARAPEIIMTAVGAMSAGRGDEAARRGRIAGRPGWSQIPAVRDQRIELLVEDQVLRPGPRLADGLEAVANALEPRRPGSR